MKRFEYKILDAAVIEPHRESEELDLTEEDYELMLTNLAKKHKIVSNKSHRKKYQASYFKKGCSTFTV